MIGESRTVRPWAQVSSLASGSTERRNINSRSTDDVLGSNNCRVRIRAADSGVMLAGSEKVAVP